MKKQEKVMTLYTGTKTVSACRMGRKEAEEVMNRKVYNDSEDREDEDGYLVKYPDGYLSWSPRKVFEESYDCSETRVDRMMIELKEVKKRYLKGREFSFSLEFNCLSIDKRNLLRKQLDQMEAYIYTLARRVELELHPAGCNCGPDPVDFMGNTATPLREKQQ